MAEFKITSIGIDTTSIRISPGESTYSEGGQYDYAYTKISANNDYLISDYLLGLDLTGGIIVGVDFLDDLEEILTSHAELVSDSGQIATLLLDSKLVTPEQDLGVILDLTGSGLVSEVGIMNPTSSEQIKLLSQKFGDIAITEVGMDICPLNFNLEVIEYCQENNIKIIGFNPFGGYINGPSVIEAFSCPYLLGFSANYCDTVIVSGRDLIQADESKTFLEALKYQESNPKFVLRKSVSKLNKPIKPLIRTSLKTMEDLTVLPYIDPDVLYNYPDLVFNFIDYKKNQVKGALVLPDFGDLVRSEDEIRVLEFISNLTLPEETDILIQFAYLRYHVLPYLTEELYPCSEGWNIDQVRIGDRAIGMKITKEEKVQSGHWWSKKETTKVTWVSAILALPEIGVPVFLESGRS